MNNIQVDVLASIIWIILMTVPLLYTSIICHLAVCQATEITKIMNETVADSKNNGISQIDLELISLQFIHQKPQFSACGFFSIDMTFAYAVCGAVTTYLVILLQFKYG
ncbi:putative gustatory receptor 2a [Contarinia nasturtii]|uniref:putative gustatory receptor 2a n=1 Tax=Contarinia nasturtii TaxID=265458 RepID=UPI0012D42E25|nr:putative gustatory receptor 2a [Contarinia nasturtii]